MSTEHFPVAVILIANPHGLTRAYSACWCIDDSVSELVQTVDVCNQSRRVQAYLIRAQPRHSLRFLYDIMAANIARPLWVQHCLKVLRSFPEDEGLCYAHANPCTAEETLNANARRLIQGETIKCTERL